MESAWDGLRFFRAGARYVAADMGARRCFELSEAAWEAADLGPHATEESTVSGLAERFGADEAQAAWDELRELVQRAEEGSRRREGGRRRILVPGGEDVLADMTYQTGGARIATARHVRALAEHVDIIIPGASHREVERGIREIPLNHDDPGELRRHFAREQYEGVFLSYFSGRFSAYRRACPYPVVCRLDSFRGHNRRMDNAVLEMYAQMRDCDAFVSVSDAGARYYSERVADPERFAVIPNAADTEQFYPTPKPEARCAVAESLGEPRIAGDRPIVGFFSRFQPEKGSEVFLNVARLVPECLFLIVAPLHARYAPTTFPPNVIHAGHQPRHELSRFINCFDLHCFPSMIDEESYSLAVLEAMACGIPPVVTAMSGLPEAVGDAGFVVPVRESASLIGSFACQVSAGDFANVVRAALADRMDLDRRSGRCVELARRYTWEDAAACQLALFERLNALRGRRREETRRARFVLSRRPSDGCLGPSSILLARDSMDFTGLSMPAYQQSMIEGLALRLLRKHGVREIENVLLSLCGSKDEAGDVLRRVAGFHSAA